MRTSCPECGRMLIWTSMSAKNIKDRKKRCVVCKQSWTMRELEDIGKFREREEKIEKERQKATEDYLKSSDNSA